jgi:SAM-dependent methyltransferase
MLDWHARFCQQAEWTRELRAYLFAQAGLPAAQRVLEVGCGTGAVLGQLETGASRYGVDINPDHLNHCLIHAPQAHLTRADACHLPYPDTAFDITYCHFLLLWTPNPRQVLREMRRVTRPGGAILALAEPDYSRRIDRPEGLVRAGQLQRESLRAQGADPDLGGRLAGLFASAGIRPVETGELQRVENDPQLPGEWDQEWAVMQADLAGRAANADIQKWKELDRLARQRGERVLHVPTHFAWGHPQDVRVVFDQKAV